MIPGDEEWPTQVDQLMTTETLDERGGPPLGLWVRGPMRLDELDASVAVVGSRSATTYGTAVAGEIGARVARAGYTVVSGAAFGIDQAAHRGALAAGGRTVAVLACGVDRAYPAAHRALLDHLATTAAVVSELAPGRSPTRIRFLSRNRIIAALTRGTVVVEAAVRSGALNTAGLGGAAPPAADGSPGPGHGSPVRGRAPAGPQGCREPGHPGRGGARAGRRERRTPRRATPRLASRRVTSLPDRQQQVLEAVPLRRPAHSDSIARTAGIGLLDTRSILRRARAWRVRRARMPTAGGSAGPMLTIRLRKPQKFLR